jgi:hypothetical protein
MHTKASLESLAGPVDSDSPSGTIFLGSVMLDECIDRSQVAEVLARGPTLFQGCRCHLFHSAYHDGRGIGINQPSQHIAVLA